MEKEWKGMVNQWKTAYNKSRQRNGFTFKKKKKYIKLKKNQEISENRIESISTQLTRKLDTDEAQAFSGSPTVTGNKTVAERYLECSQTYMMELSSKIVNSFYLLTIFAKKLHHKCSTTFYICLCLCLLFWY